MNFQTGYYRVYYHRALNMFILSPEGLWGEQHFTRYSAVECFSQSLRINVPWSTFWGLGTHRKTRGRHQMGHNLGFQRAFMANSPGFHKKEHWLTNCTVMQAALPRREIWPWGVTAPASGLRDTGGNITRFSAALGSLSIRCSSFSQKPSTSLPRGLWEIGLLFILSLIFGCHSSL